MDYAAIIHAFVDDFVENKDAILIRELKNDNPYDLTLLVVAEGEDTSRLIGRKGIIANALREVLSIAGKIDNRRVHLKFETFEKTTTEE
ncbi:MAG: KH domain-containing protein [Bacilli bacterium]